MLDLEMIVMDLDGTLITSHQTILSYTRDILMQYQEKGVSLVLSSGRDIQSIMKIGKMLNMFDYHQNSYICLNGLEIYDTKGHCLHVEEKLKQKDARQLASLAKLYHIDMVLFFEDCLYILEYGHTGKINGHFMTTTKHFVDHFEEIPNHYFDCLKKIAYIQEADVMSNILKELQERVKANYDLCLVEDDWVEINPLGIGKGKALKVLSQMKDIPLSHIIAFGNGENDIDMLKMAGRGIAMENSFDTVKEKADDICGHYEQDGIAYYLLENYPLQ